MKKPAQFWVKINRLSKLVLPPGDILERRDLFQQRLHRRALRGRDGGKIKDCCGLHARELSETLGKHTQNQAADSLCRSRW
ncbi:hypothetical protein, partial [Haematobacter missouriensis]|uniref:hypothetical protein n=1 Tax=Haematobacter missouriensis TaxID=366616 RepID=UPI001C530325